METLLRQLGQLFLDAVPTVIIFVLLHIYLRHTLYHPLKRTLAARRERTEGQFEIARRTIARAEERLSEYEHQLRQARGEMYRIIESRRKAALEERNRLLAAARASADQARQDAEARLAAEMATAKRQLEQSAQEMARVITGAVLREAGVSQPGVGA